MVRTERKRKYKRKRQRVFVYKEKKCCSKCFWIYSERFVENNIRKNVQTLTYKAESI